jgi:hypothetical protein
LRALFEPVCRDYVRVVAALGNPGRPLAVDSPQALVRRKPESELPNVDGAFEELARRGVLEQTDAAWAWGPRAADIALCRELYAWPDEESAPALHCFEAI